MAAKAPLVGIIMGSQSDWPTLKAASQILDELKVDAAKGHLRDGNLPISQIAWLLGYREVSAFTNAFKRWTGSTPRQYRSLGKFTSVAGRSELVSQARRR